MASGNFTPAFYSKNFKLQYYTEIVYADKFSLNIHIHCPEKERSRLQREISR
jgi:hypothetical protein